jgi:sulfate adenylyltransferase subunit 2
MSNHHLNYLEQLEAESIHIFREIAAQFERPALLFSGGKDSITLVHLARKAFAPGKIPFPLVHIDTGHNFQEALDYRDAMAESIHANLIVRKVEDTIKAKNLTEAKGKFPSRNWLQTYTLLDTIEEFKFDACIGGARRDEEKARAKERIFSVRDDFGQWNPKLQRPELWNTYNGRINKGENVRVFPISNWTELDIWNYILQENIKVSPLYFAKERPVVWRGDQLIMVDDERYPLKGAEKPEMRMIRFRTLGCYPLTAGVESNATAIEQVVQEVTELKLSERATRLIDGEKEDSMEKKKTEGYF